MALSDLPVGEMIVSAIGGGGLAKAADFVFGRKSREVKALGEVVGLLSTQVKEADRRLSEFGAKLDDCHQKHEECEAGRREDRKELAALKRQIDALTAAAT